MSKVRVQVITRRQGDLARDHVVNTVYFDDFNIDPTGGTNWQTFANDVRGAFLARGGMPYLYGVETRVYNMADAEPRPVKAYGAWQGTTVPSTGNSGAREVALCLSYYSERNLPRFRGRIYVGPWQQGSIMERPNASARGGLTALATALAGIGGPDVDWGLWSPTRAAFSKITAGWVDDEWDTVRSRGMRSTLRDVFTTSE
jgi:hypothetical protein